MNTSADRGWGGETRPNPNINETCCAYNLAKLTKDLNSLQPLLTQAKAHSQQDHRTAQGYRLC